MIDHIIERIPPMQFPLVNRFYKETGYQGTARGNDIVFVLREHGKIIAAVRLCPGNEGEHDWLLLRGLWVRPERQRRGLASALMTHVVSYITNRKVWCYPDKPLEHFYARYGFETIDPVSMDSFILGPFEAYIRAGREIVTMVRKP